MEKIAKFLKKNKNLLRKVFSLVFMSIFIIFTVTELRHINFREYHKLFVNLELKYKFLVIALGLVTFLFSTMYDFLLSDYFKIGLKKREIFKISFITQSFNNFISFGGLTGTKLRSDLLVKKGVDQKTAIKMATSVITSGLLGLFFLLVPTLMMLNSLKRKYLYLFALLSLYIPFYFLAGRLNTGRFKKFTDENSPYSFLDTKIKLKIFTASVLDWIIVSMYFSFTIRLISPEIPFITVVLVYLISEMVGIISFIPGGIGSFDLSVYLILSDLGYQNSNILLSLLLFRMSFYVIPWIIGVILYIQEQFKVSREKLAQSQEIVVNVLSTLIFISGVILIVSTATPAIMDRIHFIRDVVPRTVLELSKSITLLIGVILIVMSRGIKFKIKKVYKISLVLLVLGSAGCLVKGLDYEEAIVLMIFAGLLFSTRELFTKEHLEIKQKDVYKLGLYLFIVLLIFITIYNLTHKVNIYTSQNAFSFYWIEHNPLKIVGFFVFVGILLTLFLYSRKDYLEFEEVKDEDVEKFCNFMKDYEGNYFTHLYFMKDKNFFINSKNTVLMQYRPYKDNIVVLGDPVGERDDFEEAIDEIIEFASEHEMKVSFYEVLGKNLELYANQGFSFIKIGEDATVDVGQFTYEGKKNKNLRKQHNRLDGIEYSFEMMYPPHSDELIEELRKISDSWLNKKSEMGYSIGSFDEYYLSTAPIAVLRDSAKDIIVFANLLPVVNTKKMSIDLMRYDREKCQANEMDLLILGLIDWCKDNGYEEFYLGMAPLSNVGSKKYSGGKEKAIKLIYDYGNKIYSFQGLRYFKEKFHPRWQGIYIVYKSDMDLPDMLIASLNIIHRQK